MMTSAQVVETSVNVTSNSPSQDYTHPDDHNLSSTLLTSNEQRVRNVKQERNNEGHKQNMNLKQRPGEGIVRRRIVVNKNKKEITAKCLRVERRTRGEPNYTVYEGKKGK